MRKYSDKVLTIRGYGMFYTGVIFQYVYDHTSGSKCLLILLLVVLEAALIIASLENRQREKDEQETD